MAEQAVIAAAAGDLSGVALGVDFDLKHEARIIFKAATKLGGEGRLRKVDAASLEAVIAMEDRNQVLCSRSDDFNEGIRAFLEKRKPAYTNR